MSTAPAHAPPWPHHAPRGLTTSALLILLAILCTGFATDEGPLVTRVFHVPPDFLEVGIEEEENPNAVKDPFATDSGDPFHPRRTARDICEEVIGITFHEGTSAYFSPTTSQLIIRNTPEACDKVEAFVTDLLRRVARYVTVQAWILETAPDLVVGELTLAELREKPGVTLHELLHLSTRSGQRASIESGELISKPDPDSPGEIALAFGGLTLEIDPIIARQGDSTQLGYELTLPDGSKIRSAEDAPPTFTDGEELLISATPTGERTRLVYLKVSITPLPMETAAEEEPASDTPPGASANAAEREKIDTANARPGV